MGRWDRVTLAVWIAIGSAVSSSTTAQVPDRPAPGRGEPVSTGCANKYECRRSIYTYVYGRLWDKWSEAARVALERERALCTEGDADSCEDLASWTALGVRDFLAADLASARSLAQRACDVGSRCRVLKALSHPPPTDAESDDIREAAFRDYITKYTGPSHSGQQWPACLAFGTEEQPWSQDPPPALMARFRDTEHVKPSSWCAKHALDKSGVHRLSVVKMGGDPGTFDGSRTMAVRMMVRGIGTATYGLEVQAREKDGAWVITRPCWNKDQCRRPVHDYMHLAKAERWREDARSSLDRQRALCAEGQAELCEELATWTAVGVGDLLARDGAAARALARRACDLGSDCKALKTLSHPPPTAADRDDIREAAFRRRLPKAAPGDDRSRIPVSCLAFGTEADTAGQDPPPAFMARFQDLVDVKPRSWCIKERTGNRLSAILVDGDPGSFDGSRSVGVWMLVQGSDGTAHMAKTAGQQKGGAWVVEGNGIMISKAASLAMPARDLDDDRQRIEAVAAAFAAAWNGRDFDQMARLHGQQGDQLQYRSVNLRRELVDPMRETRLEAEPGAIEFDERNPAAATVRLPLRGTWARRPGAIAPLEPWKHEGAVTSVRLQLQKVTSAWEPGDWRIKSAVVPWQSVTYSH